MDKQQQISDLLPIINPNQLSIQLNYEIEMGAVA